MVTPHAGAAPLIGREREVASLRACLDAAIGGRGGAALIAGEPGIGKTRLAEEIAVVARERGARVLWGRTYEGEGAPAYWPWIEILRGLLRGADADAASAPLGAHAGELAQLLPELRQAAPDLPEPAALEPAQARFRLFDAVTAVLSASARQQPLVLVLDDLHWADEPSLLLLEFLARSLAEAPLLVLGTYRDGGLRRGDPLARVLGDLTRRPGVVSLTLVGLDAGGVARMIEAASGAQPTERLVRALAGETDGNPLFLGEMVRLLAADGRLRLDVTPADGLADDADASRAVPHTVRAVIGRRLDHLSAECGRVLAVAAVAGRDFDLPVLERVAELPADALLALLEEAEVARLIAEAPGVPGRYRFTHALIRESLYEEIPATRRTRLHRQVAEALEAAYAADEEAHLAELAHHFAAAAAAGGAEKAVAYLRRAGDRALEVLAYEEAARLYDRALAVLKLRPGDADEQAAVLLALGDARNRAGDREQATATFEAALAVARRAGLPDVLARAALGYAGPSFVTEVQDNRAVVSVLEEALAAIGPQDSPLRVRLLTRLSFTHADPETMDRAIAICREAITIARRLGDRDGLARALHNLSDALNLPEQAEERAVVAEELVALAEAEGDAGLLLRAHERRLSDAMERGDVATADVALAAYSRLAESLRQPLYLSNAAFWRSMRARMAGRFEESEAIGREALALAQRAARPDALIVFGSQILDLRRMQGRLAEVEPMLRGFLAQFPTFAAFRAITPWLSIEIGRTDDARAAFEAVASQDFRDVPVSPVRGFLLSVLGRACAALRDRDRAALIEPLLAPYAERAALTFQATSFQGSCALSLGHLAALLGRPDEAAAYFERALAFNRRAGARPFVAQAQFDYAAFLLDRAACAEQPAGRRERARALLAEAAATARELGMPVLRARAEELAGTLDAAPAPAAPASPDIRLPDGLTTREVEVLALVAEGCSNAEVAERLVVSVSTVQNHLRHIYDKIDVRSRSEATAYAFRHGLAAPPAGA